MERRKWKHGAKSLLAIGLSLSMIVIPMGNLAGEITSVEAATPEESKYIDFGLIEHDDFVDAGSNCTVNYTGTTFTATATDWGGDWGGDALWQTQLKSLIPVTAGQTYTISFTAEADAACNFTLKAGDKNDDNATFYLGEVSLEANTPYTFTKTTSEVTAEELMILFALGGVTNAGSVKISNLSVQGADGSYVDVTPYINFEYIDHDNFFDGSDCAVTYAGTSFTATATDWGGDWGGDALWQTQLKNMIPVTAGENYTISFTAEADAACSFTLKAGDSTNDSATYYMDTVSLEANTPYNFAQTTTETVTGNELMLLFALGAVSGPTNIKVSNLSIKGETSGWVVVSKPQDESTGIEYDFSAGADHSGDAADPGTSKGGYDLIWADEFDGNYGNDNVDGNTGLNLDNWAYQLGDGTTDCSNPGWGNKELQCYTADAKNIGVNEDLNNDSTQDGLLRITAAYEENGYTYGNESTKSYTSARLRTTESTDALFNTTYGYIESRISLPQTKGTWPAFWMLPQSTSIYGSWPVSGEIDIMETVGVNADKACGTLHWGAPEHVYKGSGYVGLDSAISNFHTYAIDWQPGQISWIYDGKVIYTSTNWESGFSGASDGLTFDAPFDQPFYMLLNLAVDSGQFGGNANKAAFQGKTNMYVDYVRAYQKTAGYPESVERTASDDAAADWESYAGINQIATLGSTNLEDGMGADAETDISKWYKAAQADAEATITPYNADGKDWAKVGITTAGSQDYSVQLIGHYNAKAGYTYKVSFDAYADGNMVGKTVNCDSKEWSGWSTYGIQSFELEDTAGSYSYLFNQTEDFDNCRIEFNIGAKGTGNVYIGNVKVEIVDPSSITQEAETRKPLSNGNLIYNGTFDQGSKHFGYWSTADGTSVTIPRYTTSAITAKDVSVVDIASKTNYEHISDGVKYYERRAQISAAGAVPTIYQPKLTMIADSYETGFDMYSAADTNVTVAIYSTKTVGGGDDAKVVIDKELQSKTLTYKAADGVKNMTWSFDTSEKKEDVALVFQFDKGASVQLDNVALIGASQGEKVQERPITSATKWTGDDGSGQALELKQENGVITLEKVVSNDSAWYTPQIVSENFAMTSGKEYTLSFKYKMTGESNNKANYIIQENGGGWYVYNGGPTEISYDATKADADGFCSYEVTFTAGQSLAAVHMVFGLGKSGAAGNCDFSFKNVSFRLSNLSAEEETGKPDVTPDNPTDTTEPSDADGNKGWTAIVGNVTKQPEGSTVSIDLGQTTEVPKDLLAAIVGKDITVKLKVSDTVTWIINGKNVTSAKNGIKLGVALGKSDIPADVVKNIAGKNKCIELSLEYDGDFGFGAKLDIFLGKEYAGQYANLYYYNEATKTMEYTQAVKVGADGRALFSFNHASDYVVVFADTDLKSAGATATTSPTANVTTTAAKTGDNSPLAGMMILFLFAGLALAGTVVRRRNSER